MSIEIQVFKSIDINAEAPQRMVDLLASGWAVYYTVRSDTPEEYRQVATVFLRRYFEYTPGTKTCVSCRFHSKNPVCSSIECHAALPQGYTTSRESSAQTITEEVVHRGLLYNTRESREREIPARKHSTSRSNWPSIGRWEFCGKWEPIDGYLAKEPDPEPDSVWLCPDVEGWCVGNHGAWCPKCRGELVVEHKPVKLPLLKHILGEVK